MRVWNWLGPVFILENDLFTPAPVSGAALKRSNVSGPVSRVLGNNFTPQRHRRYNRSSERSVQAAAMCRQNSADSRKDGRAVRSRTGNWPQVVHRGECTATT